MADRTVRVTLIAQATGYIQGMDQAARKTRELGSEAEKLAAKRQAFTVLGQSMLAVGVAAIAGVGLAISKFAEFDKAMSNVNAVTNESVSTQNDLRTAALAAGGATVYTATESANAIEELAKAGIGAADVLGGALTGSLNLAASGELAVARAAEITGITLKQFQLDGTQAGRVADVLSAGANKAVGSVEDLAQGLKFVGPVAASMNVSLEDTVATLALFADQGIIGEQAGTSLRGMLSSLTSPSSLAKKELDRLNITLYDGAGKFLGLENTAGQLKTALGDVTDAERDMSLGILFGNQQITAARVLVQAGAESWSDYRGAVDDAGVASRIAAERMNNLSGDVEKLGGAFDTALIKSGSGANETLRTMVQSATFVVDAIGNLPQPVLDSGLALGILVGAVGVVGGAALIAVPKIAALRQALADVGGVTGKVGNAIGLVTTAVSVATVVLSAWIEKQARLAAVGQQVRDSLDTASGAFTRYSREIIAKELQDSGAARTAQTLGISLDTLTEAAFGNADAIAAVTEATDRFTGAGAGGAFQNVRDLRQQLSGLQQEIGDAPAEWEALQHATEESTTATGDNAHALSGLQRQAESTSGTIDSLVDALSAYNEQQYKSDDATLNFKQTLLDLDEAMGEDGFTGTLDTNTQQGVDNYQMLLDLTGSANAAAAQVLALTGNQEDANAVLAEARGKLEAVGTAFGLSGQALQEFIDKYLASPQELTYTAALLGLEDLDTRIGRFYNKWNGRTMTFYTDGRISFGDGGANLGYASGGYTGDGDKNAIAGPVHRREWVSTAETLAKPANRAALEYMHAGGNIAQWSAAPSATPVWTSAPAQYATASTPATAPLAASLRDRPVELSSTTMAQFGAMHDKLATTIRRLDRVEARMMG